MFCFKKVYEEKGLNITEETNICTNIPMTEYTGKLCLIRIRTKVIPILITIIGTYNLDRSFAEMTNNYSGNIKAVLFGDSNVNKIVIRITGTDLMYSAVSEFEIYFLENTIV